MKQINDKERIAAAMENPNLKHLVDQCIEPSDMWMGAVDELTCVHGL